MLVPSDACLNHELKVFHTILSNVGQLHIMDCLLNSKSQFIVPHSCSKLPTDISVPSGGSLTVDQWLLLATIYGPIAVHFTKLAAFQPHYLVINRSPSCGASLCLSMVIMQSRIGGSQRSQKLKQRRVMRMLKKQTIAIPLQRLRSQGRRHTLLPRPDLFKSGLPPLRPRRWKS